MTLTLAIVIGFIMAWRGHLMCPKYDWYTKAHWIGVLIAFGLCSWIVWLILSFVERLFS